MYVCMYVWLWYEGVWLMYILYKVVTRLDNRLAV